MAGIPYYLITSCCDQSTTQGQFIIPGAGIVANGVYVFNGITFQEGTTGMWFYSGFCYQVEYLGTGFSTYPTAFNQTDISTSIGNVCSSSDCAACGIALPPAYTVYNCCDAANVVNLNINQSPCATSLDDGIWIYNGPGYSTDGGFVFNSGECYNFTRIEDGIYENGPDCDVFTVTGNKSCKAAQLYGPCPACDLGLQYLVFRSCCGTTAIFFKGIDANSYYGIREYLGTLVDGLENICYSIVIGNVGDFAVPNLAAYNALPDPPAFIEGVTFSTISPFSTTCEDFTSSCPSCFPLPCYTLYNCAGESFNTTIDLSAYTNTWILITNYADSISGPYLVIENTGECKDAVNTISFANTASPCQSKCYEATGEGEITYVNDSYNLVTIYSPAKFCSYIYPTVSPGIVLTQGGNCVDSGQGMQCPEICYTLTNCQTSEVIHSNTQSLEQYYLTTSVVTLNGHDGCWYITHGGDCSCAVPVTVLTAFQTCQECLPVVAYQFTNCQNPAIVLYSSEDYSDVLGFSVLLDCDTECYTVTQINFKPPVESSITILTVYNNCTECLRTYFKLEDCQGIEPDVYTYTNLTEYNGNVIKLKDCDTCWQVDQIYFLPNGAVASIVLAESSYTNCISCLLSAPCVCSKIRNDDTIAHAFEYIDCEGHRIILPTLQPGQTSDRVCLISWDDVAQAKGYIEYYGDCINGTCPPIVYPVRYVKPGYHTPACDTEKWDKITCKSSEILYKSVLKGRYGISNCCDEPTDKWLIKKELIDLAALVDPHYVCTERSCGCPPSSCGCDCGSTPKTCNSN
jgi:hypothetical protein